jgi:hypothetical protein
VQLLLPRIPAAPPPLCCLLLLPAAPSQLQLCKLPKLLVLAQLRSSGLSLQSVLLLLLLLQSVAVRQPPALQRSLLLLLACLSAAAGDDGGIAMARPKSPSMARLPETNTFSGLMSRCTKPCMPKSTQQAAVCET